MITILQGAALEKLRELPDESVQCCVTSPPSWGLRDYGTALWEGGNEGCDHKYSVSSPYNENFNERWGNSSGARKQESERHEVSYKSACGKCGARRIDSQLGLEKTPEEFCAKMVEVFREVRRTLRSDGVLFLNLGDSYASGGERSNNNGEGASTMGWPGQRQETLNKAAKMKLPRVESGLKPKDLCGIPWRVAFALQADGWWLRSDIIWAKPNPMPESVTDRPTKSHEYIFLLTKSASYFYDADAIKEEATQNRWGGHDSGNFANSKGDYRGLNHNRDMMPSNRNKRSVWTIATQPYPEAHFATFPEEIPKLCIMAGTSAKGCCARCGAPWERVVENSYEATHGLRKPKPSRDDTGLDAGQNWNSFREFSGTIRSQTLGWQPACKCECWTLCVADRPIPCTVLDPFAGSGTTGAVALELGRKAVLIELNPKYCNLIQERCDVTLGLALA